MAKDVHERMVEGAMLMLARHGLQGTSFSKLLSDTGAPRGSLYHHFPGGKDQLVGEAIDYAGKVLTDALESVAGEPPKAVVERFLAVWRAVLTLSSCESGCAVLAVTVTSDSAELLAHATTVFRGWRDKLADLLRRGGLAPAQARNFAVVMIASVEGAVVLSRADQSMDPFEAVASQLLKQAEDFARAA